MKIDVPAWDRKLKYVCYTGETQGNDKETVAPSNVSYYMNKKDMALLDWDRTLYDGFVLLSWVRFLSVHGKFSRAYYEELKRVFSHYSRRDIKYDDLSRNAPLIYARGLKGQRVTDICGLALEYVREDSQLYPHSIPIFDMLHQKNITIAVLSGAPQEVLDAFSERLDIEIVIGITVRMLSSGEFFSGVLGRNSALVEVKRRQVERLRRKFNILLAIGDSSADIPLLMAAKVPIVLNDNREHKSFSLPPGTISVPHNRLLTELERALKNFKGG